MESAHSCQRHDGGAGVGLLGAAPVLQQGQVEGEVLQVFPSVVVITNEQGQALVLQLTPRTQMSGRFKPGDKIVQLKTNTPIIL